MPVLKRCKSPSLDLIIRITVQYIPESQCEWTNLRNLIIRFQDRTVELSKNKVEINLIRKQDSLSTRSKIGKNKYKASLDSKRFKNRKERDKFKRSWRCNRMFKNKFRDKSEDSKLRTISLFTNKRRKYFKEIALLSHRLEEEVIQFPYQLTQDKVLFHQYMVQN